MSRGREKSIHIKNNYKKIIAKSAILLMLAAGGAATAKVVSNAKDNSVKPKESIEMVVPKKSLEIAKVNAVDSLEKGKGLMVTCDNKFVSDIAFNVLDSKGNLIKDEYEVFIENNENNTNAILLVEKFINNSEDKHTIILVGIKGLPNTNINTNLGFDYSIKDGEVQLEKITGEKLAFYQTRADEQVLEEMKELQKNSTPQKSDLIEM